MWFSRCRPEPLVTRSGSITACTRVSPPCSGVFITALRCNIITCNIIRHQMTHFHISISRGRDDMIYGHILGQQGERLHPPDIDVEVSVDNPGVDAVHLHVLALKTGLIEKI